MDLPTILSFFGCSASEHRLLIEMVGKRAESVTQLSQRLGVARPTLYDQLDGLIERGLVQKEIQGRRSLFSAQPKDVLVQMLRERSNTLSRSAELLEKSTHLRADTPASNPKVFVYEGANAYRSMALNALKGSNFEMQWFWPVKTMIPRLTPALIDFYHAERIRKSIHLKVLWPEKQKVEVGEHPYLRPGTDLREIRLFPHEVDYSTGYGIFGNRVAFLPAAEKNYAFIIESKELSATMRSQFMILWDMSIDYRSKC